MGMKLSDLAYHRLYINISPNITKNIHSSAVDLLPSSKTNSLTRVTRFVNSANILEQIIAERNTLL